MILKKIIIMSSLLIGMNIVPLQNAPVDHSSTNGVMVAKNGKKNAYPNSDICLIKVDEYGNLIEVCNLNPTNPTPDPEPEEVFDESALDSPLSQEWFNNFNYDESVGSYEVSYLGVNYKAEVFLTEDSESASRMYTSGLTQYANAQSMSYTETYEISYTNSLNTSATIGTEVSSTVSAEVPVYLAKVSAEVSASVSTTIGFEISISNTQTTSVSTSIVFENTRTRSDSSGTYYVPMRLVKYVIYMPVKLHVYIEINDSWVKLYKDYIVAPIRYGLTTEWSDGYMASWNTGLPVAKSDFSSPFEVCPSSIADLF